MTGLELLQKKLKEEDSLGAKDISGVMKSLRKGEPAYLDKRKALAQLGYDHELVVDRERIKANRYREEKGLSPLNMDPVMVKPTDDPVGSSFYYPNEDSIKNRTEQSIAKPNRISGYLGGEVQSPVEILGHELTHSITQPDFWRDYESLGVASPRTWDPYKDEDYVPVQMDGRKLTNAQLNLGRVSYPEYNAREYAPPLAAMTRLEYQLTGERIDTPEKFDKKIAQYDAMSSAVKTAFKKTLPTEVSRFYNFLDIVSDPKAEPIRLWGTQGKERMPVFIDGKDRRKRFLDISREMIPSLVEKEDSFEEAVNRRLA